MLRATRVVAVCSGKGGVGKSFVSLHLARGLADFGYKTLLVDLDLHAGGALAAALGISPAYHVMDVPVQGADRVRVPVLPMLSLVSPPSELDQVLLTERTDLSGVMKQLLLGYDWAVLDLSHRLDLATVSALSLAHWVWVVTLSDPLSLYGTRNLLSRLAYLGLNEQRMRIVVNRASSTGMRAWPGLNTYVIPYDRSVEGGMHPNGVYSQVCMERVRWLALENVEWVKTRKDPPRASSKKERAHDRSYAPA